MFDEAENRRRPRRVRKAQISVAMPGLASVKTISFPNSSQFTDTVYKTH